MADDNLVPLDTKNLGKESRGLAEWFQKRIKGQGRAVEYIVRAWTLRRLGLQNPNRPIFSALFLGPSGVGKTLLAELLVERLFQDRGAMTKIDCANFSQPHQVSLLVGSPPGYVGFREANDNEENPYPILSQWNIDKHHYMALRKRYEAKAKDIDRRADKINQTVDLLEGREQELKQLEEKLKRTNETIQKLEMIIAAKFSKANCRSSRDKRDYKKTLRKLKELKGSYQNGIKLYSQLSEQLLKDHDVLEQDRDLVVKDAEAGKREGWIYNSENPAGYVSVILLDEIEKAHDDLFNHLLAITDKGKLQLSNGKITNFHNSFIFMAGNVASDQIAGMLSGGNIGFKSGQKKNAKDEPVDEAIYRITLEEAQKTFRPEFLGRLDKIVVFRPLSDEAMSDILGICIEEACALFVKSKKPIAITLDETARKFLIEEASARSQYGARELRNRVQRYVVEKLIRALDNGSLKPNDKVVGKLERKDSKDEIMFYKESLTAGS